MISAKRSIPKEYANVWACASRQLADFISWIQQQDFYENTTIVIAGDHCSMAPDFYKGLPHEKYHGDKLPAAICLSLLGGVMVLFFRRRFSLTESAMMSLLICLSGDLYDSVNNLQAEVVFMFFSMLTLLLVEVFVTAIADHRSCVGIGLLYGVIAWFMREVRLNGSTVIIIALVGHVIAVLKKQVGFEKKNVCLHLLP